MKKSTTPLNKTDLSALRAAVGKVVPTVTKSETRKVWLPTYTR